MNQLGAMTNEFLWLEERKLVAQVLHNNELGLAWDETEKRKIPGQLLIASGYTNNRARTLGPC